MNRRVAALYNTRELAEQARQDLMRAVPQAGDVHLTSQPAAGTAAPAHDEGFWGSVRNFFGFDDTSDYQEATRRGGILVTAEVPEDKIDQAVAVLNRHNPIDVNRQVEEWKRGGWRRPAAPRETATARKGETVIPVAEEKLNVGKQREERGGVRVYSHVVEKPVRADVNLREEQVVVQFEKSRRRISRRGCESI